MSLLYKHLPVHIILLIGLTTVLIFLVKPLYSESSNINAGQNPPRQKESEQPELISTLESINLRLASLEDEYRKMEDKINSLSLVAKQTQAFESDDPVEPEPPEMEDEPEPEQSMAERKQQKINQISDYHHAETSDIEGTLKIQGVLEESMERLTLENSQLNSVDCRSSLCRMEFSHADGQSRDLLTGQVGMLLDYPTDGVIVSVENGTDTPDTVVYFTREGQELPDFVDE